MRTKTAVCLALLVFSSFATAWPQESAKRAYIRVPAVGGVLYTGGVIEVVLEGLAIEHAGRLEVVVRSQPVAGDREPVAICQCGGSEYLSVVQGPQITGQPCAVLTWTDRERGQATLHVTCNHLPEGVTAEDHLVQVEVLVKYADQYSGRWQRTAWHRVRLEDSPHVRIVSPDTESRFIRGAMIPVKAGIVQSTLPVRASLEISGPADYTTWHSVDEDKITTMEFFLEWETSQATELGRYAIRVVVEDDRGYRSSSEPVYVEVVEGPVRAPTIMIRGKEVSVANVAEVEQVQFGVADADRWGSFQWDFGDGAQSYESWPRHAYARSGTFTVCLTVWPEPEFKGSPLTSYVEIVATERPAVSVSREIYGFPVPGQDAMGVLPNTQVHVRLLVKILRPVVGLIVTETCPTSWKMEDRTELKDPELEVIVPPSVGGETIAWIVTSRTHGLSPDTEFSIEYTLRPPESAKLGAARIDGRVQAQLDPLRVRWSPIPGRGEVTVLASLPIPVALAYLERRSPDEELGLKNPGPDDTYLLTEEHMDIAQEMIGREVPYAGGAVLTPEVYLQLLSIYEADESIRKLIELTD